MHYRYLVQEVSNISWQEIMDSDDLDAGNQHLNHWGDDGWDIACVVPKMENGTTVSYGIVFKKAIDE